MARLDRCFLLHFYSYYQSIVGFWQFGKNFWRVKAQKGNQQMVTPVPFRHPIRKARLSNSLCICVVKLGQISARIPNTSRVERSEDIPCFSLHEVWAAHMLTVGEIVSWALESHSNTGVMGVGHSHVMWTLKVRRPPGAISKWNIQPFTVPIV